MTLPGVYSPLYERKICSVINKLLITIYRPVTLIVAHCIGDWFTLSRKTLEDYYSVYCSPGVRGTKYQLVTVFVVYDIL